MHNINPLPQFCLSTNKLPRCSVWIESYNLPLHTHDQSFSSESASVSGKIVANEGEAFSVRFYDQRGPPKDSFTLRLYVDGRFVGDSTVASWDMRFVCKVTEPERWTTFTGPTTSGENPNLSFVFGDVSLNSTNPGTIRLSYHRIKGLKHKKSGAVKSFVWIDDEDHPFVTFDFRYLSQERFLLEQQAASDAIPTTSQTPTKKKKGRKSALPPSQALVGERPTPQPTPTPAPTTTTSRKPNTPVSSSLPPSSSSDSLPQPSSSSSSPEILPVQDLVATLEKQKKSIATTKRHLDMLRWKVEIAEEEDRLEEKEKALHDLEKEAAKRGISIETSRDEKGEEKKDVEMERKETKKRPSTVGDGKGGTTAQRKKQKKEKEREEKDDTIILEDSE